MRVLKLEEENRKESLSYEVVSDFQNCSDHAINLHTLEGINQMIKQG